MIMMMMMQMIAQLVIEFLVVDSVLVANNSANWLRLLPMLMNKQLLPLLLLVSHTVDLQYHRRRFRMMILLMMLW